MDKNGYQVLHCHTSLSDGTMTHKEVLDTCLKYGISTVAFTDHDVVMPEEVVSELKVLNHPVRFISGIEISATHVKEVEGNIPLFHIIGLFVDNKNQALVNHCIRAKQKRLDRLNQIVANLKRVGFDVSVEEILHFVDEGTVGRPHIARALLIKDENKKVITDTLNLLRLQSEIDPKLKERYEKVKNNEWNQLLFDLFLTEGAFIPNVYVPYLEHVTLDEAVALIRGAGGIAIMAHPTYYRDKVGPGLIEKIAGEGRVDGIETAYAVGERGEMAAVFEADIEAFRRINNKYNLISGGGGDFHKPEDFDRLGLPDAIETMQETRTFLSRIFAKLPGLERRLY